MHHYGQEPITVNYYLAKFQGHKQSGSGIMISICHVISQNHVIKGLCDFIGGSPKVGYHPANFGSHRHYYS